MLDFDFLTWDEVVGDNTLEIFHKSISSLGGFMTDFARLLGNGDFSNEYVHDGSKFNYFGCWYTKTIIQYGINKGNVISFYKYGVKHNTSTTGRMISARPVIKYSKIKDFVEVKNINKDEIPVVEFGEYPQFVVDDIDLRLELQSLYESGELKETGKVYTTDSVDYDDEDIEFNPTNYVEYEFNGEKYIRFIVGTNGFDIYLSDDSSYDLGDTCWIKVEPIKWLVDEKNDKALSEKLLFSGIQYCYDEKDINDFKKTDIKKFMDTYFSKEILTKKEYDKLYKKEKQESIYNPYSLDFDEVSEEEIIKGCVESNIAVMLHGRSGDGKSARVKEIDPDAEILYLINASPDSLGGKSIVYNGEMIDIPPTWYTRLKEKCEKEPDKIHIVFFDEITNAPPSIQGMAFNIILDKEVNGRWKLPDNARIVAAGNELEESRSAYGMSEPLFNRFAHVYIETKVEDWLSWASTPIETYERLPYKQENIPMKIHPSIYAFIAYKSFKGEDVLRSKFDGIKPNADPRKWELASKVLYETRKPEMLRSLVGEPITREFVMFCRQRVITLEDVLNDNYTEEDLRMDTGEKYNTAVGLSSVSIEHFEKVREFVKRLGSEICATFETLWARGLEERLEKIQEIKLSERTK